GFNGMSDIPPDGGPMMNLRSFFEVRNIPHLMLWLDHPHWHADQVGLLPQLQGMFRSANSYHFLKNSGHALEMERIMGWPNCFELPAGVDPEQFPVVPRALGAKPEFDLVAICSERGELPEWLKEFVSLDEPNAQTIRNVIRQEVRRELDRLWQAETPPAMHAELTALGDRWASRKASHPFQAAHRHWPVLVDEFPGAAWFLTMSYPTYMKAVRILWKIREWERRFYVAYLARFCRVGIFGGDWSPMGLGPGGWIDFLKQSETYARGRVALNITDGHDEEGLTMKPFEIAASGVPMLHYQAEGLERCFTDGDEVMVFSTPRQARQKLDMLLDDSGLRHRLAAAARSRVLLEHTWEKRVLEMFRCARLHVEHFRDPKAVPAALPPEVIAAAGA
ncbi:MAG TPA: glycosyltransferase, partial [Phycisphaerae bacterium]|nr:glycosyltransferase [Phycisphaerae bacterium]